MLQRHLHAWAETVDERNYVVRLRDDRDRAANREYDEGPTDDEALDAVLREAAGMRLSVARLSLTPGIRLLDVCSGRGYLGEIAAERHHARVIFADLSTAQLAQLRRRSPIGARRDACVADVLHLPWVDGAFDVVVGHSFLHHLRDVPLALRELRRVLRQGGRVALLHEPNINANFWESFPLSVLKNTDPRDGFTDLWMFTPSELRRLFADAGFEDVRVRGTGIASGLLVNAWLLVLTKAGKASGAVAKFLYRLRTRINALELGREGTDVTHAPSLLVTAVRGEH